MLFSPVALLGTGWHNLKLAARSLWLHKLRTFLSILGIIIGVGAVIVLMAFGEGSMEDALADIRRMGATNIIIRSAKPVDDSATNEQSFIANYGLDQRDLDRLKNVGTVTRAVPLRIFKQKIYFLSRFHTGRVVGTTREYADVHKFKVSHGRFLIESDNEQIKNHCVLGSTLASALFPVNENPVGQQIKVEASPGNVKTFVVVGVLAYRMPTGGTGGSQAAEEFNDDMYVPLETCNARFGPRIYFRQAGSRTGEEVAYHQITLTVDSMDNVKPTAQIVAELLRTRTGRDPNKEQQDWVMTVPLDKLEQAENAKRRYQALLFQIGSISLLVGGIGIMNIMLATVTERTREIGIRRALGAKQRDITAQFLTEAVVQTTIGGVLGVLIGLCFIYGALPLWESIFHEPQPVKLHVPSIFLAFSVAVVVGVAFGWYPARQAARMDPIEALRHV